MIKTTIVRGLMAVTVAALLGGTAMAQVVLPTQAQLSALGATQYQIAFVTTDTTSGTSGLESTYNSIAAADAAESSTLNSLGASWTAITSTTAGSTYTDASTNAPTYSGVPIFNTAGQLLLSDGSQLYHPGYALQHPIDYDNTGAQSPYPQVWTGTYSSFLIYFNYYGNQPLVSLGGSEPALGDPYFYLDTDSGWNTTFNQSPNYIAPVYALSSPITAVPEPSTLVLLGSALLGLGFVYLRRRTKA